MKTIRLSLLLPFLLLGTAPLRAQILPAPDPSLRARKLAPALALPGSAGGPRTVRVQVGQTDLFRKWLAGHLPAVQVTARPGSDIVVATGLDEAGLQKLLGCPWVRYVDVPNRVAREELAQDRLDLTANKITPVHGLYPALTGEGLALSVKEQPFDKRDIDFRGRMLNAAAIPNDYSAHATMMASMAVGGGNSAPSGKGVAWRARLAHASFTELLPNDAAALLAAGISVQNHSYGVGIENYYGLEAREYDQSTFRSPALLHVFSSGNAGRDTSKTGPYAGIAGYGTLTGQFKMAKNTLSVGALDRTGGAVRISSRGPAYDGRVKPELAALGEAGTSDAAALVSGISLLVQQAYRDRWGGTLPPAALVKAALLNSADDAGRPEVDFETGFGNADALGAVRTVLEGRFLVDSLAQDAERVYTVRVPAGGYRLKGTLVWHDPEAAPNAARALVNDLDLQLRASATGARWRPWLLNPYPHPDSLTLPARRGEDHLNNAEQITLTLPAPGTYEFRVRGYRVTAGRQAYSLAYEIEPPFAWVYPVRGTVLAAGTPGPVRWEWPRPDTLARLEYRVIGSDEWLPAGEEDGLPASPFQWTPPDTAARMQLRLVSDAGTFASDTFTVAPAITLREGYRCGEELMLYWLPAPGASGYQLYRLGDQYLEPFLTTADTLLTLNPGRDSVYYAVAPLFGGTAGQRGNTIVSARAASACYVVSLLPRQQVTDTVLLDLEVATTYRLRSVHLERWTNGRFVAVQSVSPVNTLTMTFADPMPAPGGNRYRVRIENVRNEIYYSGEESVFYIRRDQIMVFPNPVRGGQPVHVAGDWGTAPDTHYRLYDHLGKLQFERRETGTLHQLPTLGLRKGIYLLEARTGGGPPAFSRFVVQ